MQNMNNDHPEILNRVPKSHGMTGPEGYFDNFASAMMERLPQKQSQAAPAKRTLWLRVRPYIYMAAMFGGVWLMMWMFNDMAGTPSYKRMADNPVIANVLATDQVYQYYDTDVEDIDILDDMYENDYIPSSFTIDDNSSL
jgi:hypothetical protein